MYQFYTAEIKKTQSGEFEHDIHWYWDENEMQARLKGEAAFYEILSRAATSTYLEHAAILFSSRGNRIMDQCYTHAPVIAPVETENMENYEEPV